MTGRPREMRGRCARRQTGHCRVRIAVKVALYRKAEGGGPYLEALTTVAVICAVRVLVCRG